VFGRGKEREGGEEEEVNNVHDWRSGIQKGEHATTAEN
jgi:hypothetical protein